MDGCRYNGRNVFEPDAYGVDDAWRSVFLLRIK